MLDIRFCVLAAAPRRVWRGAAPPCLQAEARGASKPWHARQRNSGWPGGKGCEYIEFKNTSPTTTLDLAGAKAAFERALRICHKFLGNEHPTTKTVRKNLEFLGK
jgi:hypothetical protein